MNYEKLYALTKEDLKKLINLCLTVGKKSTKDMTEEILDKIKNLKDLSPNDFIKEDKVEKLYSKRSPAHYRWFIPEDE